MISNPENNTVLKYDSDVPPPPPAHFDADMIAAAQPVEPLANQAQPRRRAAARRLSRGNFWLLAALSVGLLLSAAVVGMILGLQDGYAESRPAAVDPRPSVVNQSVDELPAGSASAPQIQESSHRTRSARRILRIDPVVDEALTETRLNVKPIARKVGEIFVRSGKQDRRVARGGRRHGDSDYEY